MTKENHVEHEIFQMISRSGQARSLAYEAWDAIEEANYEQATQLLKQAEEELAEAHKIQTKLITAELNGENLQKTLLLIHAQDHLMTAMTEEKLIKRLIRLIKHLHDGGKR
jgi:PTS system cellobiose-specific IIA component